VSSGHPLLQLALLHFVASVLPHWTCPQAPSCSFAQLLYGVSTQDLEPSRAGSVHLLTHSFSQSFIQQTVPKHRAPSKAYSTEVKQYRGEHVDLVLPCLMGSGLR
jgi:hypothetical protein